MKKTWEEHFAGNVLPATDWAHDRGHQDAWAFLPKAAGTVDWPTPKKYLYISEESSSQIVNMEKIEGGGRHAGAIWNCMFQDGRLGFAKLHREADQTALDSALLAKDFSHPNVLRLAQVFEDQVNNTVVVWEWVPGEDLLKVALRQYDTHELLPQSKLVSYTRQTALGVQYLHEMQIALQDMKLENIMLAHSNSDTVKLVDLEAIYKYEVRAKKRPPPCAWAGTKEFAPPEFSQVAKLGKAFRPTPALDIWCLGKACLERLLFLWAPYPPQRLVTGYCSWSEEVDKTMPQASDLLEKLLAPFPEHRPTIQQVLEHPWLQQGQGVAEVST